MSAHGREREGGCAVIGKLMARWCVTPCSLLFILGCGIMGAKCLRGRREGAMIGGKAREDTDGIRTRSTTPSSSKEPHLRPVHQETRKQSLTWEHPHRRNQTDKVNTGNGSIVAGKRLAEKDRAILALSDGASTPSLPPADDLSESPKRPLLDTQALLDYVDERAELMAASLPAAMTRLRALDAWIDDAMVLHPKGYGIVDSSSNFLANSPSDGTRADEVNLKSDRDASGGLPYADSSN